MNEREIVDQAGQLTDPAERSAFLGSVCGEDRALRGRLEDLVAARERSGSALDRPPGAPKKPADSADWAPTIDSPVVTLDAGHSPQVGPYKLLEEMGEGGMGVVYLAEQTEPVRRRVALKLIKPGMDSRQVIARFEAERQALAMMDHPNIARVLDAGTTDHGRPYFVMELVQGVPLTQFADQQHLSTRERLELFVPICQAVQHAHQKGLIHRDLKPSNILVALLDGRPVPKVIDFGVAKALHHQLTGHTVFTGLGQIIGTLEYMSPEQAEHTQLDIDTRSDIYSLGVVLYELLTGDTPHDRKRLQSAAMDEVLRIIREEEPPRPSTRLTTQETLPSVAASRRIEPARLSALLRGELDWIVMKALEKDRARRYDTASGLALDIERFLSGEAVLAAPPSRLYQARKFVRRHRGPVIAASLLLLALLGGLAGTSYGLYEAEKSAAAERVAKVDAQRRQEEAEGQRARAEQREEEAIDAVRRFGDAVAQNPALKNRPQLETLRKTLLKEPLGFLKSLRERMEADLETRPGSLARLAKAAFDLGRLTDEIGDKQDALRAYEQARAIQERLVRENPTVPEFQGDLSASHHNIGNLLSATGQATEALAAYREALAIEKRLARENPTVTGLQVALAASHHNIGNVLRDTGQPTEALAAFQEALAIREPLGRENPTVTEFQSDLAASHNNIGDLIRATGQPAGALAAHKEALAIRERLVRENPSDTEFQADLARSHNNIGTLLGETGQLAGALAACKEALAIRERLTRQNPTVTQFQRDLSASHHNIGTLLSATGQATEALAAFQEALAIGERLARENPTVTQFQGELARSHNNIGNLLHAAGQPVEALAAYKAALSIQERLARENPTVTQFQRDLAASHYNIGILLHDSGQPAEALASFQEALAIQARLARENPTVTRFQRDLAASQGNIGNLLSETGQPAEALAAYKEALAIGERLVRANPTVPEFQQDLAGSHNNIGILLGATGQPAGALAAYKEALAIRERLARENPAVTQFQRALAASHNNIGILLGATGQPAGALAAYKEALAIQERLVRENPAVTEFQSDLGSTVDNVATLDLAAKRFAEARDRLLEAVERQKRVLASNPGHPTYQNLLGNHYINLLEVAAGLHDDTLAAEARRGLAELGASDPRLAALDQRLADVLEGKAPGNNAERLALAQRAYDTERYAVAARLWAGALEAAPELAESNGTPHRYNAACAAVLAGAGRGRDEPTPEDDARAELRARARSWLEAELESWARLLAASERPESTTGPPGGPGQGEIQRTLEHWKGDPDLAGVRGEAIDTLPEPERAAWRSLWGRVEKMLAQAGREATAE